MEGWGTRTGRAGTWVTIPPDGIVDRARDVLDGMVHERALWDGVPEPRRSRIVALAAIVAATLGAELDRVPGATWNRRAPGLARAFGLATPVPVFCGAGASILASRSSLPASSARRSRRTATNSASRSAWSAATTHWCARSCHQETNSIRLS